MPERSGEDVGETVAGEVVEDAAAGLVRPPRSQTDQWCNVAKSAELDVRRESVERNQVFRLDLLRVFAERHLGDVQEPAHPADRRAHRSRDLLNHSMAARSCLLGVDGFRLDRDDAARRTQAIDAVVDFPLPDHAIPASAVHSARWRGKVNGCPDRQRVLETSGGLGMLPIVHQDQAKELMKLPRPGDLLDRRVAVDLKSGDFPAPYSAMPRPPANCLTQLP